MQVHVFKGSRRVYGFTEDSSGSNLPDEHGPWASHSTLDMNRGEHPRIAVNTDEALDDIERQGFHLVRTAVVTTERTV